MRVRFAPPTLAALDLEAGGTLVLTAFSDERPIRGLAGRVDWRLCGRLSELLVSDDLDAAFGAALLCPIGDRLPFSRLMFVGLGPSHEYSAERYAEACHVVAWKLARMGETDFAMSLPTMPAITARTIALREAVWGWRQGIIRSFDSAALAHLNVCVLAERTEAAELHAPMSAIAAEVNDALQREAEQRAIANAPPMPTAPKQRTAPAQEDAEPAAPRRGWSSGVMKIGPAATEPTPVRASGDVDERF